MLQDGLNTIVAQNDQIERRLEWIFSHRKFGLPIREVCSKYQISISTYYKWDERYGKKGIAGLIDLTSGPRKPHNRTSEKIVVRILKIAKSSKILDANDICHILQQTLDIQITVSTIQRILLKNDLARPKGKRSRKVKMQKKRIIQNMMKSLK